MDEILQDLEVRDCLAEVFSRYPIVAAYLYGSVARGQATPLSDVDIGILVYQGENPQLESIKFELEVEDLVVGKCGLRKAELRVINGAPILIRGQIVTEGLLLYCRDEDARVEFETRTRSEYFDFLPVAERLAKSHLKQIHLRGLNGQRA
jgi:predicted nucleotidyltransferase